MNYQLEALYSSLPNTNRGRSTIISCDPKGQFLVYVNKKNVYIRSIDEPSRCDAYSQHSVQATCAKFSPSGYYIASADERGKVRIWDSAFGKEHILKSEYQPVSGSINDLAWSSDSQRIVVGCAGRERFGHVFNADTGTSVGEIMGMSKSINCVCFRAVRPFRIATGSEDGSVCLFSGPPFKFNKLFEGLRSFVNAVQFSHDGKYLACGDSNGNIFILDGLTGTAMFELGSPAHKGSVYGICWDPSNSNKLLSVSGDKTAKLWDVSNSQCLTTFEFGSEVMDQQVGCVWHGKNLITVSLSGFLNYLNLDDPVRPLRVIKGHNKPVTSLTTFTNCGKKFLLSGSADGLIFSWDVDDGLASEIKSVEGGHTNRVQYMRCSSDLVVSCGFDDAVWYIDPLKCQFTSSVLLNHQPLQITVSKKDTVLVLCEKEVVIIKEKLVEDVVGLTFSATCFDVDPNGEEIAIGGKDNKLRLYAMNELSKRDPVVIPFKGIVCSVAYSPDNRYLAVADSLHFVHCFDRFNGMKSITDNYWQYHAAQITSLRWNPSSTLLASCSVDTHVMVYKPSNVASVLQIRNAHRIDPVSAIEWAEDDILFSAGHDCCIRKWRLITGK